MLWVCISLFVLAAIVLFFYIREKCKAYTVRCVLLKAFISLLFIAVAVISAYEKHGHVLNPFVVLGLVLGASGDIWLDLKFVYPKEDKIYSYAGFIVFGLGHICFITGMFLEFGASINPLYWILPIAAAAIIGIVNLFLEKPMKLKYGDMKAIVYVYSVVLFSMPLSALSLCIFTSFQNPTLLLIFIGGILFAVSDLVLSNTYFGEGHEKPIDFILNYITYYPAQFLIAFSLFFL